MRARLHQNCKLHPVTNTQNCVPWLTTATKHITRTQTIAIVDIGTTAMIATETTTTTTTDAADVATITTTKTETVQRPCIIFHTLLITTN